MSMEKFSKLNSIPISMLYIFFNLVNIFISSQHISWLINYLVIQNILDSSCILLLKLINKLHQRDWISLENTSLYLHLFRFIQLLNLLSSFPGFPDEVYDFGGYFVQF